MGITSCLYIIITSEEEKSSLQYRDVMYSEMCRKAMGKSARTPLDTEKCNRFVRVSESQTVFR